MGYAHRQPCTHRPLRLFQTHRGASLNAWQACSAAPRLATVLCSTDVVVSPRPTWWSLTAVSEEVRASRHRSLRSITRTDCHVRTDRCDYFRRMHQNRRGASLDTWQACSAAPRLATVLCSTGVVVSPRPTWWSLTAVSISPASYCAKERCHHTARLSLLQKETRYNHMGVH